MVIVYRSLSLWNRIQKHATGAHHFASLIDERTQGGAVIMAMLDR